MKRLLFLILFLHTTLVFSQERDDDYMFVRMMETDAVDLKCQIYPTDYTDYFNSWDMLKTEIPRLIESGRYIISMTFMKFGIVVLHKENTEHIKQAFKITIMEDTVKAMFKQGYSLKYLNKEACYGLYEFDPKVTKQVILKKSFDHEKNQKQLAKQNAKGLYLVGMQNSFLVYQNGRDDIGGQIWDEVLKDNLISTITTRRDQGYIATCFYTNYHDLSSHLPDEVEVVFDMPLNNDVKGENVAMVRTAEQLVNYLSQNVKPGYSIDMTWGGWDNDTGRSKYSEIDYSSSTSIWDVLIGLTNTVTGLIVGPNGSTAAGGNTDYDSHSGDGHSHSGNSISDRCSLCQGSGKCSPRSYSNRKSACSGSGLCGYCNGAGWIGSGDNRAVCTACNGDKKCKTCHGTGKCQQCNGTGRK